MTATMELAPRERGEGAALLQRSLQLAGALTHELSPRDLRTGRWFTKLLSIYLRHYDAHVLQRAPAAKGTGAAVTEAIIRRACGAAFLSGAGSGSLTSGITAVSADAGAPGLMVAIPASGLVITTEMLVNALINLGMACDLASAFRVRFDPEDPSDFSRLYAITRGQGEHAEDKDEDSLGLGRVEHLAQARATDLGEDLGAKLLGESVSRNLVPFLNVVTSSVANWRRTRHLGNSVLSYVRLRRALEDSEAAIRRVAPEGVSLLLESAWFLFVSDGRLRQEESAVLTHQLSRLSPARRQETVGHFVEDVSAWLKRLRSAPARAREVLMWSLHQLSAADLTVSAAERDLLHKAAEALHTSMDGGHLDTLVHRYREEGVAHAFAAPARAARPARQPAGRKGAPAPRAAGAREEPTRIH
ncbi:TerB family tellurite resistance protein [Corallococcus exiguus]|uniref:tellurite resistance TerB family protein n=1 Tax=Corallococcus TaxID=83461 RepID=UPI000EB8C997|nr:MULTISPECIES: TerB family tellurite resistance protein [Corallococcus]NNB92690.1 TerB family tellurite resistance protein [Corallococcus exiguus]NNC01749.1 TerB family tellurite resistance protein [Corallococcus exiguus]NPC45509.1 TerB family tellurite resistance protein [Corallococcus exiguus]RKH84666.1 TerB family tellurite resistance protein [Corallococcus sp. AB032C]